MTITVVPGVEVVSIISTRSAASLALAVGKPVYAMIKASSVIVGID